MIKELAIDKSVWEVSFGILPDGYKIRPARREDLDAVVATINAALRANIGVNFFSTNELGREWNMPGFDLANDSRLVTAPDGQVVGYYDVFDLDEPHVRLYGFGFEHPDYAGKGIAQALVHWGEQRARLSISMAPAQARVVFIAQTMSVDQKMQEIYRQAGFDLIRHSLRMVIELDQEIPAPEWPAGIAPRPFVLGRDDEATVRAISDAFADHWGYVEHPFENELARYRHMWENDKEFDPGLYFLASDGDRVAGISLCHSKVEEDPQMGWVGTLGVLRPWRRKGLGLALLRHSFLEFKRRGKARVGLGVDAQSLTGATGLYEKAGMRADPKFQWSAYQKELRPGIDLSTQSLEMEQA